LKLIYPSGDAAGQGRENAIHTFRVRRLVKPKVPQAAVAPAPQPTRTSARAQHQQHQQHQQQQQQAAEAEPAAAPGVMRVADFFKVSPGLPLTCHSSPVM
jgi:hypothetical protein